MYILPRVMKNICKVGCIACGACAKAADKIFEVKANLAELDYEAYDQGDSAAAAEKCPTKVIVVFGGRAE